MSWKCKSCGAEITEEDLEQLIEDGNEEFGRDLDIEEVDEVILVDCHNCDDELATYEKNTTDFSKSEKTKARSAMLEAARSKA